MWKKLTSGLAIISMGLSVSASAQDDTVLQNDDLHSYNNEDVIIVGAVRAPDEALAVDIEGERFLTHIPKTVETADDKEAALLAFALQGLDETQDSKPADTPEIPADKQD